MARAHHLAALKEFVDRAKAAAFDLDELLVPWQKRVRASKAKKKALIAGRRSGKTFDIAAEWTEAAARKGELCLYSTLTRQNAKEIIWGDLVNLNRQYGLGGQVAIADLQIRFPRTGGLIALTGVNNAAEVGKARGKKWHRVALDEPQSIPERLLVPFITDALAPTLMDFGGELRASGTRPAVRAGWWYDVISGKIPGWEIHQATVKDNLRLPAILAGKSIEQVLADVRELAGWKETDVGYLLEILNEDIEDLGRLLYEYSATRNTLRALPLPMTYVLGIDVGSVDSDAIAVLGWSEWDPNVYLVEEHVKSGQDVTDLAEAIKPFRDRYQPVAMVIDEGGGAKKTAEELRNRHGLALEAADKPSKSAYIRMFNADLRKGRFLCREDSYFAADTKLVHKDRKALMHGELREDKNGYHSDICDAVLYGWRRARHYLYEPPVKDETTEEDKMRERLLAETAAPEGEEWLR